MNTAVYGFGAVLTLAFLGVPLGFAMLVVGVGGFALQRGLDASLVMLSQQVLDSSLNYGLSVLPMFILMGTFIHRSGVSDELYDTAHAWVRSLRGGLGHATVMACAMFGMISGSSLAAAATMSKVAIPQMRRRGYGDGFAAGCVASSGVLGMLIPPSVPLMIYGLIADQDIRKLFIAVTLPGLLVACFFMLSVWVAARLSPHEVPAGEDKLPLGERIRALKGVIWTLVLFVCVIGGMYGGVFTTTEAAGVGCLGAALIAQMRKRLGWRGLFGAATEAGRTTAMLFLILFGAMAFTSYVNLSGLAGALGEWVQSLGVGPVGVLLAITLVYLALGCVLESMSLMVLTVPIFLPILSEMGISPLWFGIYLVLMIEIGQLTPPVGMNVLTVTATVPDLPKKMAFKGVMPFLVLNLIVVALIVAFPQIVMAPVRWLS